MLNRMFLALCFCCVGLIATPVLAQDAADGYGPDAVTAPDAVTVDPTPQVAVVVDVPVDDSVVVTVTSPAELVQAVNETTAIIGGLIMLLIISLMEAAKGLLPGFAGLPKLKKRSFAILGGGAIGIGISFIPMAHTLWYIGLIVGLIAGASATVVRALGKDGPARKKKVVAKGFAKLWSLVLVAMAGLVILATMSGCAGLTVREQQAVDASVLCGTGLFNTAIVCAPPCAKLATKEERKSCAVACVVSTLQNELPTCGQAYGGIYSESLGIAIEKAVDSVFSIYEALK